MGSALSKDASKTDKVASKLTKAAGKLRVAAKMLHRRKTCAFLHRLPLDIRYRIFDFVEEDEVERSVKLLDLHQHPLLHVNSQLRSEYLHYSFKKTIFQIRLQFFHNPTGPRFVPDEGQSDYIQPQYAPTTTVRKTHWLETFEHRLPIRRLNFILVGGCDYPWAGVLEVTYSGITH